MKTTYEQNNADKSGKFLDCLERAAKEEQERKEKKKRIMEEERRRKEEEERKRIEEERRRKEEKEQRSLMESRRAKGLCPYCGGTFRKGLLSTKCVNCGRKKDY